MKNEDLLTESYDYDLPNELIASRPMKERAESRLLVYNVETEEVVHARFKDLPEFLNSNSTLVLNQSKVFPCRLVGKKPTGGKVEVFLLSLEDCEGLYPALIKSNGTKKIDETYILGDLVATNKGVNEEGNFLLSFDKEKQEFLDILESQAKVPIPPYIRGGESDDQDKLDYQTVYAKDLGSVAAPTAGLHFTENLFETLENRGIDRAFVTLHVGLGTFKPVNSEEILEHKMHREYYQITSENLERINSGKKLIAVGTTSLRVLESSYKEGNIVFSPEQAMEATDIFLYPGKEVHSIAGLITNFHLPKSTLLMLVSSLIGRKKALELYQIAIEEKYRFFSYGDAMLILRN